jgi:hypothetical protein
MPFWPFRKKKPPVQPVMPLDKDHEAHMRLVMAGWPDKGLLRKHPYGGFTEEHMAWVSRERGSNYMGPRSPVFYYRQKEEERARKKMPHVRRAATLAAIGMAVTAILAIMGTLPGLGVLGRFAIYALAISIATPVWLEAWPSVRDMEGFSKLRVQALVTVLLILPMYPLAVWINSFDKPTTIILEQKVMVPPNGQARRPNSNGAVRKPLKPRDSRGQEKSR